MVMLLVCSLFAACTEDEQAGANNNDGFSVFLPQSAGRNLDLLFVIDNSESMAYESGVRFSDLRAFYQHLRTMRLNLHLGVTSTDLGAGQYTAIEYCDQVGGDRGILGMVGGSDEAESCVAAGQKYIVDVEPARCTSVRDQSQVCIDHSCTQADCDTISQNNEVLTLVTDSLGCPRCRNYTVYSTFDDTAHCLATIGVHGCGYSQPLEAMYQALNNNLHNAGFLREDAFLGVIFVTDDDDCSVADPELFDPSQDSIDSTLGYRSRFRCFEFGVTCDIDERTHVGLRQECRPRDDHGALLHPISRYVQFLLDTKDPEMLFVAALAGPADHWTVTVGRDSFDRPELQGSCTDLEGLPTMPGIRMRAFVEAFNGGEDLAAAYESICGPWGYKMRRIGERISGYIFHCLPAPLAGCSDVGVEFGSPRAEQTCEINSHCLPTCLVTDVFERGAANEQRSDVPHCLEVMPDGTVVAGNIDRTLAYADGHPEDRDADLPVPACWYIAFHEGCADSNYARITISRQADPPPRSFAEVTCRQIDRQEQNCSDGKDNDEDCMVDSEDEDCW